jgi:hypothetical protein
MAASGDCRAASSAFRARAALCTWIHKGGGAEVLRPLAASERAACLGIAGRPEPHSGERTFNWAVMGMLGNGFAVPVISHLIGNFAEAVKESRPPVLLPGGPSLEGEAGTLAALRAEALRHQQGGAGC